MSKVWVMQHMVCETLGTISDALNAGSVPFEYVRIFEGQPVPIEMGDAAGLILMGGPMGVYEQDHYPFLRQEIRLIEEALRKNMPVLGICLGSQLLAAALGARVTQAKDKEIGWRRVSLTRAAKDDPLWSGIEPAFTAYHWHGDVFDLPSGAVSLASSDRTRHQAFRYGRSAYGILFHMEVTEAIIRDMVETFRDELQTTGLDGLQIVQQAGAHLSRLREVGRAVFSRWAGLMK
ncbi:MAG: gamma-glutamyl-gamma-aminobutyrate hydrolase family protein [Nitrospirae bacterium]|nr:gamma-glutamyl-gamma-aminobutyrate hydrolase family protein [Nitrospirota bacterium]